MPLPTEQLPTWRQLVRLEPRLGDLEEQVLSIEAGVHFCANEAWVRTIKPCLAPLVGWSRREDDLSAVVPPGGNGIAPLAWWMDSPQAQRQERVREHIRREEIDAGLGVLWSSEVYDLAYRHLYRLLPDCSGRCPCASPRGSLHG